MAHPRRRNGVTAAIQGPAAPVSPDRPGDRFRELAAEWRAIGDLSGDTYIPGETGIGLAGSAESHPLWYACRDALRRCGAVLWNTEASSLPTGVRRTVEKADGPEVFLSLVLDRADGYQRTAFATINGESLRVAAAAFCDELAEAVDLAAGFTRVLGAPPPPPPKPNKACKQLTQLVKVVREAGLRESATYAGRQVERITSMVPSELKSELDKAFGDDAAGLSTIEKSPVYLKWKAGRKATPPPDLPPRHRKTHRTGAVDAEDAKEADLNQAAMDFLAAAGVSETFD